MKPEKGVKTPKAANDKKDAAGQQARSRIAWLDISLPQRSTVEMIDTIPSVFRLMLNKEVALPPFSVTSTLPSIMNGGKDFSDWSRKDDLLYRTMRGPLEMVLGRDGLGLADCALAESKFEKGEDISPRMLSLIPRMADIRVPRMQGDAAKQCVDIRQKPFLLLLKIALAQ